MSGHTGLHTIPTHALTYCGPAAIAAVTGVSVAKVEREVLTYRKRRGYTLNERKMNGAKVKSMHDFEVVAVCNRLGFRAIRVVDDGAFNYKDLAHLMQTGTVLGPLIVLVTGHFLAMSRWKFVDSLRRRPVPHEKYNGQREHVRAAWKLVPLTTPQSKNLTAENSCARGAE